MPKAPKKPKKKPAGKITPKQSAFVKEYLIDRNGAQAAIRAGYSAKTAKEQASRLLTNVHVQEAVLKGEQEHADRCDITVDHITNMLYADRMLAHANDQSSAAVSASMGLAKIHGLVTDKSQVSGDVTIIQKEYKR